MGTEIIRRASQAVLEALYKGQENIHPEAVKALLKEVERRPLAGSAILHFPMGEIQAYWVGGNAVIYWRHPTSPPSHALLEWYKSLQEGFAAVPPVEVETPKRGRIEAWLVLALKERKRYEHRALALARRLLLDLPPPSKDSRWRGPREILLDGLAPAWKNQTHHRPLLLWRPEAGGWTLGRPSELSRTPFPFFAVPWGMLEGRVWRGAWLLPGERLSLLYASPFPTWKDSPKGVLRPKELLAPYLGEALAEGVEQGQPEALQEARARAALHHLGR